MTDWQAQRDEVVSQMMGGSSEQSSMCLDTPHHSLPQLPGDSSGLQVAHASIPNQPPPLTLAAQAAAAGALAYSQSAGALPPSAPRLQLPPPLGYVPAQIARLEGHQPPPPPRRSTGSEAEELRRQMAQLQLQHAQEMQAVQQRADQRAELQEQDTINRVMEERRRAEAALAAQQEKLEMEKRGTVHQVQHETVKQAREWTSAKEEQWAQQQMAWAEREAALAQQAHQGQAQATQLEG
jgi:hypothetical protein